MFPYTCCCCKCGHKKKACHESLPENMEIKIAKGGKTECSDCHKKIEEHENYFSDKKEIHNCHVACWYKEDHADIKRYELIRKEAQDALIKEAIRQKFIRIFTKNKR